MTTPQITIHDVATGETITRDMTDDEIAELIASGWTETNDETPTSNP